MHYMTQVHNRHVQYKHGQINVTYNNYKIINYNILKTCSY